MDSVSDSSLFDFLGEDECETELDDIEVGLALSETVIEVHRSKRRRKTSSAFRRDGKIIVQVPARLSRRQTAQVVKELVARVQSSERKAMAPEHLMNRAKELVAQYFEIDILADHPTPVTIKWVTNQNSRWASCTPARGTIRLSHRLMTMPEYVQDSVLLHELIHLIVPSHNRLFYQILNQFPELEKANAYLDGYTQGQNDRS